MFSLCPLMLYFFLLGTVLFWWVMNYLIILRMKQNRECTKCSSLMSESCQMICFILGWVREDSSFYSVFTNVNANGLLWAISAIPALPRHILIFIPVLPSHRLIFLCVYTQEVDACLLIILYPGMGWEGLWNDLPYMPGRLHLSPESPEVQHWQTSFLLFLRLSECPVHGCPCSTLSTNTLLPVLSGIGGNQFPINGLPPLFCLLTWAYIF